MLTHLLNLFVTVICFASHSIWYDDYYSDSMQRNVGHVPDNQREVTFMRNYLKELSDALANVYFVVVNFCSTFIIHSRIILMCDRPRLN
jgi:hypothetical protein